MSCTRTIKVGSRVRVKGCDETCEVCRGGAGTVVKEAFASWRDAGEDCPCWDVEWDATGECTFSREPWLKLIDSAGESE